ncbi:NAD(P)H-dependent flavin oxidoreductase [Arthrobacter sp. NA-172]|uniref:NAD(P)H-dependent flavin oxidoreductase n=1 Tax=Arthrobacter sp. NA-172 TaxID=3367524 RepID=UPI00375477D5
MSSVELSAAVSESGGLGSYGLYGYEADRIATTALELREASGKPFALNLWLPIEGEEPPSTDAAQFADYVEVLRPYFELVGVEPPTQPDAYMPDPAAQIQAAIEARPAVLSFVFGVPSESVIEQAHRNGIVVVGTATTVDEAVALDTGGVDAIVATGMEAGGHRVSFLRDPQDSLVGTMALVPQVVDAVSVPVIAAGGIADGRGVAAALALGADAVQIGSAFLATRQSAASSAHVAALRGPDAAHTVLTRALSGRLARGIPNRIIAELADPRAHAPFPIQNWLTGKFRPAAAAQGIPGLMSLWAGQSTPLIREDDARKLITDIVESVDAIFARLGA